MQDFPSLTLFELGRPPSTQAEAGSLVYTGQPKLHRETVSQKKKKILNLILCCQGAKTKLRYNIKTLALKMEKTDLERACLPNLSSDPVSIEAGARG